MSGFQESNHVPNSVPDAKQSTGTKRGRGGRVRASNKNLTQARVRELLDYDPETGVFTRRMKTGCKGKVGAVVGSLKSNGYVEVQVDKYRVAAHRLAWLWWYGYLPENYIDHIDRNPSNNRLNNLREVTQSCNTRNSKTFCTSKTGMRGVYWDTGRGTWNAAVTVSYITKHIGRFTCIIEAAAHRYAAEQCLDWSTCNSWSEVKATVENYIKSK